MKPTREAQQATQPRMQSGMGAAHSSAVSRLRFYEERARYRSEELKRYYHELLRTYYQALVPPGLRVLELGCGLADLLAAVQPTQGVGVDFSAAMIALARQRHPELELHCAAAEDFASDERFDYILLSDLVGDLYDVQEVLLHLHTLSHARTRLVVNFYNHLWRPILKVAEWMGAKTPLPPQNWLSTHDMANLLYLAGWGVIRSDARILWPLRTLVWANVCNRWLAPFLRHFCLTTIQIARPKLAHNRLDSNTAGRERSSLQTTSAHCGLEPHPTVPQRAPASHAPSEWNLMPGEGLVEAGCPHGQEPLNERTHYRCSIIVPARNEAGTIESLVERTPEMGSGTEIIFVEGGSTDETWSEIQRVVALYPHRNIRLLKQTGVGKAQAARQGFAAATGDLLFILDADLSVPPEELTKFYEVVLAGTGEFINGVRSVYPMQNGAMQFCNVVGNKIFSLVFSFLLRQPVKDTLCGTKVLFRRDYEAITCNRLCSADFDPFGDFDLLFGAARLNLRIVDLPVHYKARTYGRPNIRRWHHGWMLLKMVWFTARRSQFLATRPDRRRPTPATREAASH